MPNQEKRVEIEMTLNILTICLNGEPFIERHLPIFKSLDIPWQWSISEGQSANVNCSRWCKKMPSGLSTDGSHEYFESIRGHPKVSITSRAWWQGGKREMVNLATSKFTEPGVLLEIDSDEIWTSDQLRNIVRLFDINKKATHAFFKCNFWVGPDIRIIPATDPQNRWLRAWRFKPGMKWQSHEPPVLEWNRGAGVSEHDTERLGLVFDHFSLVTEAQIAYKSQFYGRGYERGVEGWRKLQSNQKWPAKLKSYFPWMSEQVMAERVTLSPLHPSSHSASLPVAQSKDSASPVPAPSFQPAAANP